MKRSLPAAACVLAILAALLVLGGRVGVAEEKHNYEVHEWSVWIADPTLPAINSQVHYPSALPGESLRSRRLPSGEKRPSPISMLTFYGEPLSDLEIELQLPAGRWLGHFPTGEIKGQRLRWLELALVPELRDKAQLGYISQDHWFQRARRVGGLYVRRGERLEHFLAYDAELTMQPPVKLQGGPDAYEVTNQSGGPLYDVLISEASSAGRRIGWLDELPVASAASGKPAATAPGAAAATAGGAIKPPSAAQVSMSAVLKPGSPELMAASTTELTKRLEKAGLNPEEAGLLLAQYQAAIFESDEMVVVVRLAPATLEERMPHTYYPEPQRRVRVALVLVRNVDPKVAGEVQKLIAQLGDPSYAQREAAQKRLTELGPLAARAVNEALTNPDPEIVSRAESILLEQKQPRK